MSKVILRKYGEATSILFSLFEIDGIDFKIDAVYVAGDVKLMKDEGAEANVSSGFTDEGQGYSQPLSATEMEHARGKLYIVDQGTKAWLDTGITIETYGHEDAQHPYFGEGVWDRSLTGATHNQPTSSGRRLRALGDVVSASVDDGAAEVNSFITDLPGSQPNHYADQTLLFTSGNLAGMSRGILAYDENTKLLTIEEDFPEAPADGDDFDINPVHIHPVSQIVQEMWDRVLSSANHNINKSAGKILRELKEIAGYEGGFIYYDDINGAAGDENFINGTLENPVDNETDLNTLLASLNIKDVKVVAGSTLTLTVSAEKRVYTGEIWTLALGGQSVSGTTFHGATVSGICTGAIKPKFEDCNIGEVTLPPCHIDKSGLIGPITAGNVGDFFVADNCHSGVAGEGAPVIDFGAAVGDVKINMRWYSGGIDLRNMGQTGIDKITIEGNGQVIINDNCVGSVGSQIAIRGHQTRNGGDPFIAGGGVITDDARFDVTNIAAHAINVIAGGGASTPGYAEEGEPSSIYQGDVVSIGRYASGDQTAKRLFTGVKTAAGDASYVVGVIECIVGAYDAEEDRTSYLIPFVADDTKTVTANKYIGQTEIRDADGVSNPVTTDTFDFNVKGEIVT